MDETSVVHLDIILELDYESIVDPTYISPTLNKLISDGLEKNLIICHSHDIAVFSKQLGCQAIYGIIVYPVRNCLIDLGKDRW